MGGGVAITYGALDGKLRRDGHHVEVLSPRKGQGNLDYGLTYLYPGFPVILPTTRNIELIADRIAWCDCVVVPDSCMLPFVAFLARYYNKPMVFNMHTNIPELLRESGGLFKKHVGARLVEGMLKMTTKLATRVHTTSPSYRSKLTKEGYSIDGVFSPRIKTFVFEAKQDSAEDIAARRLWLTNGCPEMKVMLYVGRWSVEKRIHLLKDVIPEGCMLAIVGDGPIGNEVETWHDPKNGINVLRGMKSQAELRIIYKAADLLVSASAFETLGMTALESFICGTPAILQDAPGFTTQNVEGENGFLVDFEDVDATLSLIAATLKNPIPRERVIATTTHPTKRWDVDIPNLDDSVLQLAFASFRDKEDFKTGPMWAWWIYVIVLWFSFNVISFPFITVRKSPLKFVARAESNDDLAVENEFPLNLLPLPL